MAIYRLYPIFFFLGIMVGKGLTPEVFAFDMTSALEVPSSTPTPETGVTVTPGKEIHDVTLIPKGNLSGLRGKTEVTGLTLTTEAEVPKSDIPTVTTESIYDDITTHRGFSETANKEINTTEVSNSDPFAIIHQGTVSKEQFEKCNVIINLILKPIVCIGGIIMNVIGVCVLLQKQFRRSTYTYLCFLALSDICKLLCSFIKIVPRYITYFDDVVANVIDMHLYPYNSIFFGSVVTRIMEFCICALAIERFVAVLYPLKVKDLFLCRHAFSVCFSICLFCFLTHFHYLFVYYPKPYFSLSHNITMWTVGRSAWYIESDFKPVYDIMYEFVFLYIPILVLLACNIGILIRVRQINKERQNIVANDVKSEKMSNDEKRITLTLLIISLSFLSVFVPVVLMTVASKLNKNFKFHRREHYLLLMLRDLTDIALNISSANDFLVYIYTSKQFKTALFDMVCRSRTKKGKSKKQGPQTIDSQIVTAITETGSEGTGLRT